MRNIPFSDVKLTGGYWEELYELCRTVTLDAVWDRFSETGRVEAFKCSWTDKSPAYKKPHIFWDSDVAKWMESAAYFLRTQRDADLEARIESVIDDIEANQTEDGYFNSYYLTIEPENRYTERDNHELYCTGHLLEAAIAYFEATGKDRFLKLMKRNIDCIEKAFVTEKTAKFVTPGHQELEIALLKLYRLTGCKKYLSLAGFFLDNRGSNLPDQLQMDAHKWIDLSEHVQSNMPVREMREATGHAVRAGYMYASMAEYAHITGDDAMKEACLALFHNIAFRRMYITGGVGSERVGETFTVDYDLPNVYAYTESCAAIALAFFANEMCRLDGANAIYGDVIERVLYNGFRSSLSLSGDAFFYENPLEIPPRRKKHTTVKLPPAQRSKVFSCSCCPPNITRFIPSVGRYMYTTDENTLYVNQYIASEASFELDGKPVTVVQETNYPYDGKVKLIYHGHDIRIAVRVPAWCTNCTLSTECGFAYFDASDGCEIELDFDMTPRWVEAHVNVNENLGKAALQVGPMVYCIEEVDNGENLRDIRIDLNSAFRFGYDNALDVPTVTVSGTRRVPAGENVPLYTPVSSRIPVEVRFIPYYAFANRGESEMAVWVNAQ